MSAIQASMAEAEHQLLNTSDSKDDQDLSSRTEPASGQATQPLRLPWRRMTLFAAAGLLGLVALGHTSSQPMGSNSLRGGTVELVAAAEDKMVNLYRSVGVYAQDDVTFLRWAVQMHSSVQSDDTVLVAKDAEGNKVHIKAGSAGIIRFMFGGLKPGDQIPEHTKLVEVGHPTPAPMGALAFLLVVFGFGALILFIGMAVTRREDLFKRARKSKGRRHSHCTPEEEEERMLSARGETQAISSEETDREFNRAAAMKSKADEAPSLPSLPRLAQAAHGTSL
eukprot:gb/GFBE01083431.1/.p1 GENE.gb/GFBE01083431.1/~~gb/GFBE01083431.1/.p1  ORF type:complete len:280 (+),score=71.63 gb/GFBE01083431.1/:1-840(+)